MTATDQPDFCRFGCYWECEHRADSVAPLMGYSVLDAMRYAHPRLVSVAPPNEPLQHLAGSVNNLVANWAQRVALIDMKARAVGYPGNIREDAERLSQKTTMTFEKAAERILWEHVKGTPVAEIEGLIVSDLSQTAEAARLIFATNGDL